MSMLEAAAKTPSVKKVIITSSGVMLNIRESPPSGPQDLRPVPTLEEAENVETPSSAYQYSKILSYDAAKRYIDKNKSTLGFDTAFVLPGYVQGPNELLTKEVEIYTGSNEGTLNAVRGNVADYPKTTSQVWLDDAARAHVVALTSENVVNGDLLVVVSQGGGWVPWDEVGRIAGTLFPKALEKGVLKPVQGQQNLKWPLDVTSSEEKLGFKFAQKEVWIKETVGWWLKFQGEKAE